MFVGSLVLLLASLSRPPPHFPGPYPPPPPSPPPSLLFILNNNESESGLHANEEDVTKVG